MQRKDGVHQIRQLCRIHSESFNSTGSNSQFISKMPVFQLNAFVADKSQGASHLLQSYFPNLAFGCYFHIPELRWIGHIARVIVPIKEIVQYTQQFLVVI